MAEHLAKETDVPELQTKLAEYYRNGMKPDAAHETAAVPRRDMNPALADLLAIDPTKPLSAEQVTHLLTGLRADGEAIPGKQIQNAENRARIAYIDLCLSAPKSFSVALAFAPTEAERAILDRAHRDAVDATIEHIVENIGVARKGKGGRHGYDRGHVAWVLFDHFTARPTIKRQVTENGITSTAIQTVRVAGDPQRHTHVIVPNVVLTDEGRVGGLDLQRIRSRIHEWGSVYQAFLATNLRRSGVEVELDSDETKAMNERMARLTSVPRWACDLYSKRTEDGEAAAKAFAERQGWNWDTMTPEHRAKVLDGATRGARRYKGDDLADYSEWQRQAKDAGYEHRSVLRPGEGIEPAPLRERLEKAYEASLPVLEPELERRSTFEGQIARVAAAKGLIAAGIESPSEINQITRAYRTEGVQQGGKQTALLWGRTTQEHYHGFTTALHVEQENEAVGLLQAAAADRSSALTPKQIERAIAKVMAEQGKDFSNGHGLLQREMVEHLGTAGRAVVGIGVAGSGKTTLLAPLVDAWHEDGRRTIGVTLAWRQSQALADAGVGKQQRRSKRRLEPDTQILTDAGMDRSDTYALTAFLHAADKGRVQLDAKTVIVVDEIAQVGTRQVLELARLQAKHGFQIVGLGDQQQCQAIEAGNSIRLFQKALGNDQVPELLNTIRQQAERDQETSLLFRAGKADEALARKDEDNTLRIIPGGYKQAISAAVDLWETQRKANAETKRYSIAISVPTNTDAREVGAEIRRRRQAAGEVGPDQVKLAAVDQTGTAYELPVAVGDRLRLFNRVGRLGYNGSVVEVVAVDPVVGITLRNQNGNEHFVEWDRLRDKSTGRIRLTYGDALTIDARQGDTLTEHITVMPSGSHAVNGFKAYTTESRHTVRSWIVTSEGEELQEVYGRRPLGDPRNLERDPDKVRDAVIENMARNLSRQPAKVLGSDFLAAANRVRKGSIRAMQAVWHRDEVLSAVQPVTPVTKPEEQQKPKAAPKQQQARKEKAMSETDAILAFADALSSAGFRLKGAPVMDGRMHRAPVDGDRGRATSGSYIGHLDGVPAGYIHNFKTGEEIRWKGDGPSRMSSDAREAFIQRQQQERIARGRARLADQERVAGIAKQTWDNAMPATPDHPYLVRKGIHAHGIREGRPGQAVPMADKHVSLAGRLLVPMRDVGGQLWNLQMIDGHGGKLFLPGRKAGLFAQLGDDPGKLMIAEGFATAATLRETTALTSVVAFDAGNLMPVATALRRAHPGREIVIGADNDHALPRRSPPLPNVGIEKATAAAKAVGGKVIAPEFKPNDSGTDWNDYRQRWGALQTGRTIRGLLNTPISQQARDAARAVASPERQAPRPVQGPTQEQTRGMRL